MPAPPSFGGCDFAEDPSLDARDADPVWLPDPDAVIGIVPAVRDDADPFSLWAIPGRKSLIHDGKRLLLRTRLGRQFVRLAVSLALREGAPYAYTLPPGRGARGRASAVEGIAEALEDVAAHGASGAVTRSMLVHMRSVQALDAEQAGASERTIAQLVLGSGETGASWNDSAARAKVRYFLEAGGALRDGGYRQLLRAPAQRRPSA